MEERQLIGKKEKKKEKKPRDFCRTWNFRLAVSDAGTADMPVYIQLGQMSPVTFFVCLRRPFVIHF